MRMYSQPMSNSNQLRREARGLGIGVVVVVELFAAEPDRDRRDVSALVLHFEVAIAERVANAVDDAGGPERNPQHLDAPHDADRRRSRTDRRRSRASTRMPSQFKRLRMWRSIQSFGVPLPYFSSMPGCRTALR